MNGTTTGRWYTCSHSTLLDRWAPYVQEQGSYQGQLPNAKLSVQGTKNLTHRAEPFIVILPEFYLFSNLFHTLGHLI